MIRIKIKNSSWEWITLEIDLSHFSYRIKLLQLLLDAIFHLNSMRFISKSNFQIDIFVSLLDLVVPVKISDRFYFCIAIILLVGTLL